MTDDHDPELCHAITGAYHCKNCGGCCGYLGCAQCEPELVQQRIDEQKNDHTTR